MDPRLHERRVAVIRAQGRRRLRVLVALVVALVVVGIAGLVLVSPVLDVDRVEVVGVEGARADEVNDASGIDVGDPVLLVDGDDAERALEALPWVDEASVARDLPGTIRITVSSRVLVGWVARTDGGGVALVDGKGRVLADAEVPPPDVPELVGVHRVPAVGEAIRPRVTAQVLGALPPALVDRTTSVGLVAKRATLLLDDGTEVRLGSATDLATKGTVALAVLAALDAPVAYVDVEVPSVPVTG